MDDAGIVDGAQCRRYAQCEMFKVGGSQRAAGADHPRQRRSLDVFGDKVGLGAVGVGVEYGRGREALHLAGAFGLTPEPGAELGVFGEIRADHLDRYPLAVLAGSVGAGGEEDGTHPALPEAACDAVRSELAGVVRPQRSHDSARHGRWRRSRHGCTPRKRVDFHGPIVVSRYATPMVGRPEPRGTGCSIAIILAHPPPSGQSRYGGRLGEFSRIACHPRAPHPA